MGRMKSGLGITLAALALGAAGLATAQDAGPQVREILLGSELEDGVPTQARSRFSQSDGAVYCVVRLNNPSGQAGAVRVAFERAEGEPAARPAGHRLEYPARRRYRTVARAGTRRPPGAWRCVVRSDEGRVLSHADFTITGQ